jgi:cellobiose phosphorylase
MSARRLRRFSLEPRQQRQITFITVAARSREDLLFLITKYRDSNNCSRAFELAWSHAQLEYRYLGIQSDAAFRFGELASHLLYPNIRFMPVERCAECSGPRSAYGIRAICRSRRFRADSQGLAANYWLPTLTGGCVD